MNKVVITGRLTKDTGLSKTPQGTSTCSFTVAVNRNFKNSEGNYDADFINCVAWRQTAEHISKYFHKGSWIEVAGNIRTRTYEKDGNKRYVAEVFVDEVGFGNGSKPTEQTSEKPTEQQGFQEELGGIPLESVLDDPELPF